MSLLFDMGLRSGATFSDCGIYRYSLFRHWDNSKPPLVWIMMNPSTADETKDDPTIRRCIAFAKRDGFGGVVILNVFAIRSTDPIFSGPIGSDTASKPLGYLSSLGLMDKVVVAWGKKNIGRNLSHGYSQAETATRDTLSMLRATRRLRLGQSNEYRDSYDDGHFPPLELGRTGKTVRLIEVRFLWAGMPVYGRDESPAEAARLHTGRRSAGVKGLAEECRTAGQLVFGRFGGPFSLQR